MAVIVELEQQRRRFTARRGFEAWTRRFSGSFADRTCLEDLPDHILRILIRSEEDSSLLFYGLVMGFRGLGKGSSFYNLESSVRLEVLDISLFLLDQSRFEVMTRLGWVETSPLRCIPFLDLVLHYPTVYSRMKNQSPRLKPSHPRYREYKELYEGDRPAFVRRLIPEAIQAFQHEEEGA